MKRFAAPQIGNRVEVTTDWSDMLTARVNRDTIRTLSGTVVRNNAWDERDTFNLYTATRGFPVSNIHLDRVVNLRYLDRDAPAVMEDAAAYVEQSDQQWTVEGSKGDNYVITVRRGQYSCTCKGFGYRHKCTHIETAKELARL